LHLYTNAYPGGEWTTPINTIGGRSLAEQEKRWTLGEGEWAFLPPHTWLSTLDELYYSQILDQVEYNAGVVAIDTSGDVAVVSYETCAACHGGLGTPDSYKNNHPGEETVTANAVIVSVSLGVLKASVDNDPSTNDIAFTPALSATKQAAIAGLGIGNGGKMVLEFSSQIMSNGATMVMTQGGYCGYGWTYEYKGGGNVMICYAVGEIAENLDLLPDESARIAAAVSDLDTLYAGTPFTDAFVAGFWKNMSRMKHTQGAYSYPKPGSYPTDGGPSLRDDLAAPEGTMLYFAGEATSDDHSANVTGALETGIRAAGEIDADHNPQ
jgi:monoamine oxidase